MSGRFPASGGRGRDRGPSSDGPRTQEAGEAMREAFRRAGLTTERLRQLTSARTSSPQAAQATVVAVEDGKTEFSAGPKRHHPVQHPPRRTQSPKGNDGTFRLSAAAGTGGGRPAQTAAYLSGDRARLNPSQHGRRGGPTGTPRKSTDKELLVPTDTPMSATAAASVPRLSPRSERWKRLERRLADLAVASEARAQRDAAACCPPAADVDLLEARLRAGSPTTGEAGRTGRGMEIVLGIDFGTSSTKIVARLPYEAGSPAFAVPVVPFARAEAHAYLWAARMWLAPDGTFSLRPLPHATMACAIKTNLMAFGDPNRPVLNAMPGRATAEEAVTAFLALQVRQAKGWLATAKAPLLRRGQLRWSYNFGFPAASLNETVLRVRYERCTAAALMLAVEPIEVTLSRVRSALAAVATDARVRLEDARAALLPEIAAAVAGFANSARREDGLYALVDVGGGTVDCCTFNLFTAEHGSARCPIFGAQVELLGVDPWRHCEGDPATASDFRFLLDTLQRSVIWDTKRRRYPASQRWRTGLPMFFVGGGIASTPHRTSARGLDAWLRSFTAAGAGVQDRALAGAGKPGSRRVSRRSGISTRSGDRAKHARR